jgi:hypothetical protein
LLTEASDVHAPAVLCPSCGATRTGNEQFCESCGYDFDSGSASAITHTDSAAIETAWEVVVCADRAYYDTLEHDGVDFPERYPPRRFALSAEETRIGRRSGSRGFYPEIDLSGASEDPGISRLHAFLVRAGGGYALVDPGSTNGTTLNEGQTPIAVNIPVPLQAGDRIHIGAWTTLTVRAAGSVAGHS